MDDAGIGILIHIDGNVHPVVLPFLGASFFYDAEVGLYDRGECWKGAYSSCC